MKILIACDKFRGSLEGMEVAKYLTKGIYEVNPKIIVRSSDVADGGEGTLSVLSKVYNAKVIDVTVKNAIGQNIQTEFGFNNESKIAILEMASYVGLAMLNEHDRNPMKTSTYGLGQAIKAAVDQGAKTIILGIGGSATNDGGAGVLHALGYQFLNENEDAIDPIGGNLNSIEKIVIPKNDPVRGVEIIIASDVNNLVCGPQGASFVYGTQKGAKDSELQILDDNLRHFSELIAQISGNDVFEREGYGAAGGVALSLCELLGAELRSGSELMFESLGLRQMIEESDVVITGEGKIDHQTGHGKAITPIVESALELNKKLFLVCGIFEESEEDRLNEIPRYELTDLAKELKLDSFKDAVELTTEVGRRIAQRLD